MVAPALADAPGRAAGDLAEGLGGKSRTDLVRYPSSPWPGLTRPSICDTAQKGKSWMTGSEAGHGEFLVSHHMQRHFAPVRRIAMLEHVNPLPGAQRQLAFVQRNAQ